MLAAGRLDAGAVTCSPVSLVSRDTSAHTARMRVTVAWEESWRNDLPGAERAEPFNHDAV